MMPTREQLLAALPAYRDEWLLIHPDQTVKDIIIEVLNAHDEFAPYYDKLALYFNTGDTEEVCVNLFDFCKENIKYKEETEEEQTSALPAGVITRGYGDCKHYAGFCGGVLDALNRNEGRKIKWCYRFASYSLLDATPHHVFIVVDDNGREIWIDPTPGSESKFPIYQVDKTLKAKKMALIRNIAGVSAGAVGATSLVVTPSTDAMRTLNFSATGKEALSLSGMWPHYLGLSDYRDYSGDRSINEGALADQINAIVAKGGGTHRVTGDFVKWVYDSSIRSWNFFYAGGVEPYFDGAKWITAYAKGMNEPGWPKFIITADGRLTLQPMVALDDYRNAGIQILTAWGQDMINRYDPTPYPLKPAAVKVFSQEGTADPSTANLFIERRGTSDLTKALSKVEVIYPYIQMAAAAFGIPLPSLDSLESLVQDNIGMSADDLVKTLVAQTSGGTVDPNGNLALPDGRIIPGPTSSTTSPFASAFDFIKANPVAFIMIGAGLYFVLSPKKKVAGTGLKNEWAAPLGIGVGLYLLYTMTKQAPAQQAPPLQTSTALEPAPAQIELHHEEPLYLDPYESTIVDETYEHNPSEEMLSLQTV